MAAPKEPLDTQSSALEPDLAAGGEQMANSARSVSGEVVDTASVALEETPKLYLPACGALCDILWWTRNGS
jgi:hypothetical protein